MSILILGATGQLGSLVADKLQREKKQLRVTSRRREQLSTLKAQYGDSVFLDLDDPRTFPPALKGVESLFLLTGYTVDMLVQSKAIIDAAKAAKVKHIVHLGVFSKDPACYDPHFAWHQMIEAYIQTSGIPYTFLHPNCFLQNFIGFYGMCKKRKVVGYTSKKLGWIALEDVADAAVKILTEGPAKHGRKDYWFSTESLSIPEVAQVFSDVTNRKFVADIRTPEQFLKDMGADTKCLDPYFRGVFESFKQVEDGRMGYLSDEEDDLPKLIGRKGLTVREWATLHKDDIAKLA